MLPSKITNNHWQGHFRQILSFKTIKNKKKNKETNERTMLCIVQKTIKQNTFSSFYRKEGILLCGRSVYQLVGQYVGRFFVSAP